MSLVNSPAVKGAPPKEDPLGVGKVGPLARAEVAQQPGRITSVQHVIELLPKPTPEETPYRSNVYVTGRNSADGNDYRRGEPIPYAEAVRQGQEVIKAPKLVVLDPQVMVCPRCQGGGQYSKKPPKGHTPGHDPNCKWCGPCPKCEGRGTVPIEEE